VRERVLIAVKQGCTDSECCHLVGRMGGRVTSRIPLFGAICADNLTPDAMRAIAAHHDIQSVESDTRVYALPSAAEHTRAGAVDRAVARTIAKSRVADIGSFRRPSPSVWEGETKSAGIQIPWGVRRIGAPSVWSVCQGAGVRVAIVDSGIDCDHPDLKGRVVGGYSAVGGDFVDRNGHGTHVAGTVAGCGRRGGIFGVAPRADLVAVKVLDDQGAGHLSYLLKGLAWIAEQRMEVVNMSLGAPLASPLVRRAVHRLCTSGTLLIAAAGNSGPREGSIGYPAAYASVVAVGAVDQRGCVADFSSRGESLDVVAPGTDILSTWLRGRYKRLDGTSMASPHVAGMAALLWPHLCDARSVRRAVLTSTVALRDFSHQAQGRGMISAVRAMTWALSGSLRAGVDRLEGNSHVAHR